MLQNNIDSEEFTDEELQDVETLLALFSEGDGDADDEDDSE